MLIWPRPRRIILVASCSQGNARLLLAGNVNEGLEFMDHHSVMDGRFVTPGYKNMGDSSAPARSPMHPDARLADDTKKNLQTPTEQNNTATEGAPGKSHGRNTRTVAMRRRQKGSKSTKARVHSLSCEVCPQG